MRSLAARIATITVVLVTLAVAVAIGGGWLITTRVADEALMKSLATSQAMQRFLRSAVLTPEFSGDNEVAAEIKRVTGLDVVFLTFQDEGTALIASTLDLRRNEQLILQLSGLITTSLTRGESVERIDLTFDGESWVARAEPTEVEAGAIPGSVLTMVSLDAVRAEHRSFQASLIGVSVFAILIALGLSMLIGRRIAKPVSALAEAADRAAQGDYVQPIDTRGKDELGKLARAICRLLADLRQRKEIAGYISDLSRHPHGPGSTGSSKSSTASAELTRSGPALVLALEWRSSREVTEHQAAEALEQWLPQLAQWARRWHARLVPGGSARIYLVFEPGNITGLERCLAALLTECQSSSSPPAMALASGELISSGVGLGRNRSNLISGKPVFHCERLLTEAGPGRLLLSPPAFLELRDEFGKLNAQLVLSQGQISKRRFYQLVSINEADGTWTGRWKE